MTTCSLCDTTEKVTKDLKGGGSLVVCKLCNYRFSEDTHPKYPPDKMELYGEFMKWYGRGKRINP